VYEYSKIRDKINKLTLHQQITIMGQKRLNTNKTSKLFNQRTMCSRPIQLNRESTKNNEGKDSMINIYTGILKVNRYAQSHFVDNR